MALDIYSLFICELYILGFLNIILVFAWLGARRDRTLGFTCIALTSILLAVFFSSLRSAGLQFLPIAVGNGLIMLAYGMLLSAFRAFREKKTGYTWLAGLLLWALLCCFPGFYYSMPKRVVVVCLVCVLYTGALIRLLWGARDSLKMTFWPAQLLLWIHLLFHLARIFLDDASPNPVRGAIGGSHFSNYVILESILFVIGLMFTLLAMVNERAQNKLMQASLLDPLTGVGNRRALLEQAERLSARCVRRQQPFTAVLFDLDHFKSINDRYGHQQGDRVLIDFCEVVSQLLPKDACFARLGGEEFAAVLALDERRSLALCEQIRTHTQQSQPDAISYSVSIGVATRTRQEQGYALLMAQADEALYQAKTSGRNRTEYYPSLMMPLNPLSAAQP
ncbi:GGDEF domain-containing protein [Pantoea sp.]|uniref:GGDEF domain-containing protein n=1 Tax=Pantoea sp. TaxID=69393 RepID=UPI002898C84D|nr:GGDEF domain-containing protein [Pantoea sp.]